MIAPLHLWQMTSVSVCCVFIPLISVACVHFVSALLVNISVDLGNLMAFKKMRMQEEKEIGKSDNNCPQRQSNIAVYYVPVD